MNPNELRKNLQNLAKRAFAQRSVFGSKILSLCALYLKKTVKNLALNLGLIAKFKPFYNDKFYAKAFCALNLKDELNFIANQRK